MKKIKTLENLFVEELKDLYSAETQLVKALPFMAKSAEHEELKTAFQEHLEQTKEHVSRLEQIFESLDESPKGKKCKAMEGLIAEAKELLDEEVDPSVLDAGIIIAAQKVEHYEIAGYGSARTFANLLGNEEAEQLLQQTLDEETETDERLTELAESVINVEASEAAGESSDEDQS